MKTSAGDFCKMGGENPADALNPFGGNDNYGRPKTQYLEKIAKMTDKELDSECYQIIYQAARCANNPRADWHWQADACYDEAKNRSKPDIYSDAWTRCVKDHT